MAEVFSSLGPRILSGGTPQPLWHVYVCSHTCVEMSLHLMSVNGWAAPGYLKSNSLQLRSVKNKQEREGFRGTHEQKVQMCYVIKKTAYSKGTRGVNLKLNPCHCLS